LKKRKMTALIVRKILKAELGAFLARENAAATQAVAAAPSRTPTRGNHHNQPKPVPA
jgi:hypothetical protein